MRGLKLVCSMMIVMLTAAIAQASVIDAPHNETMGIMCSTCHSYSLWWRYSPTTANQNPDHTKIVDFVCMDCHSGSKPGSPTAVTHSAEMMGVSGTWGQGCMDCHNPHYQDQLNWLTDAVPADPYLVKGTLTGPTGVTYDEVADQTTITYATATSNSHWPVEGVLGTDPDWANKSMTTPGRGLIFVQDNEKTANTFLIVSADAAASQVVVKGKLLASAVDTTQCQYPASCNSFGLIYGQLIKKDIAARSVKFFDPMGGFVEQGTGNGICQVCHVGLTRYNNDGAFPTDAHAGREVGNCTACHKHADGLKAGGHDNSSFAWSGNCRTCHDATNAVVSIVDEIHNGSCVMCHVDPAGGGTRKDGDPANGVDGSALSGTNNSTCTDCHTLTGGVIHHVSAGGYAAAGTCDRCHLDAVGKLAADHSSFISGAAGCIGCHAANVGVTTGAPTAPGDPKVHDACQTCHENTGDLKAGYVNAKGKTILMPIGGGNCEACHGAYMPEHAIDHSLRVQTTTNCSGCHVNIAGTATGVPTNVDDPMIHDTCNTCHDETTGLLKAAYGKAAHMPAGGGDCNACHDAYFSNHSIAQVNLRHATLVRANTVTAPATTNCAGCHTATTAPFVGVGEAHALAGCANCHNTSDGTLVGHAVGHAAGGECADCHTGYFVSHSHTHTVAIQPNDLGQSAGTPCSTCHNDANEGLATWNAIFVEHLSDCGTCHNATRLTGNPGNPTETVANIIAANADPTSCLSCHRDKDHADHGGHASTDFGWSGNCADCHGPATRVVVSQVHSGNCTLCHVDPDNGNYTRKAGVNGNGTAIGGSRVTSTCVDCHSTGIYTAPTIHHDTANAVNGSCTPCHKDSHAGNHETKVAIHAGCTSCHTATAGSLAGVPIDALDAKVHDSCTTCHNTDSSLKLPYGTAINMPSGGGTCQACHNDYFTSHSHGHDMGVPGALCVNCHIASSAPYSTAAEAHKSGCFTCHDTTTRLLSGSATGHAAGDTCLDCHNDGNGAYFNNHTHSHTMNTVALCVNCHTTATTAPYAASGQTHGLSSCQTCHDPLTGHLSGSAVDAPNSNPENCQTCHTTYFNDPSHKDHTALVKANTETTPAVADCTRCHSALDSPFVGAGEVHARLGCDFCHSQLNGNLIGSASNKIGGGECVTCHTAFFDGHSHAHTVAIQPADQGQTVPGEPHPCSNCHDVASWTGIASVHTNGVTGAVCATCHNATRLTGNPNAAAETVEDVITANGNPTGCLPCHWNKETPANTHGGHPANFFAWDTATQTGCGATACHNAAANTDIVVTIHARNCALCHVDPVNGNYTRKVGSGGDGSSLAGAQGATCTTCHDTTNYPSGAIHHDTAGAVNATCTTQCHIGGSAFGGDHSARVAFELACTSCHTATAGNANGIPVSAADAKVHDACTTCHDNANNTVTLRAPYTSANGKSLLMPATGGACSACHGTGYFSNLANRHDQSHVMSVVPMCATACHVATSAPYAATGQAHGVAGCQSCHSPSTGLLISSASGKLPGANCQTCHTTYFPGHTHTHTMPTVALCTSCHSALVAPYTTGTQVHSISECNTCHDNTDGHLIGSATGKVKGSSNNCQDCHTTFFNEPTHKDHAALIFVNSASTPTTANCIGCHANAMTTPFTAAGETHSADGCQTCHSATNGSLIGSAIGHDTGGECVTCHTAHFAGHLQHNNTDHAVLMRATDLANSKACNVCHGTFANTWGGTGIFALHKSDCTLCHNSVRAINVKGGYANVQAIIMDNNLTIGCLDCHTDRALDHAHTAASFVWDAATQSSCGATQCHNSSVNTDVLADIHAGDCALCHVNPGAGDYTRKAGIDGTALVAVGDGKTCVTCHDPATYSKGTVHHDTANATNETCTPCHSGSTYGGNHTALVATDSNCSSSSCHPSTAGTTSGVPLSPLADKVHDKCTSCHQTSGTLKAAYGKAPLMSAGAAGSNNGGGNCSACHGVFFANHQTSADRADHTNKVATTTSCNSCHTATAGNATEMPLNTATDKVHNACADCHNANGSLRAAWGKASAMPAGGGDCNACHGTYFPSHSHTHVMSSHSECNSCHLNSTNPPYTVAGQPHSPAECATCHDAATGVLKGSAIGKTSGASCKTCHSTYFDAHAHPHTMSTVPLCVSCHTTATAAPYSATGQTHGTLGCKTCHSNTNGLRIGSAAGKTSGANCQTCHSTYFGDDTHKDHTALVLVNTATTPPRSNCIGCHVATTSPFTGSGQVHAGARCDFCHSQTDGSLIGSASGHTSGGECITCHTTYFDGHAQHSAATHEVLMRVADIATNPDLSNPMACNECHRRGGVTPQNPNLNLFTNTWSGAEGIYELHIGGCTICHDSARTANVKSTYTSVNDVIKNGTSVGCLDCHYDRRFHHGTHAEGDGTFTWPVSSSQTNCTVCHGSTSTSVNAPKGEVILGVHSNNCGFCHEGGAAGAPLVGSATNVSGIPKPHLCTECHIGYFNSHQYGANHDVAQLPTDQVSNGAKCNECHKRGGASVANPNPLFTATWSGTDGILALHQSNCLICHNSSRTTNLRTPYTSVNNVIMTGSGVGCLDCHVDKQDVHSSHDGGDFGWDGNCNNCHAGANIAVDVHKGRCDTCHVSANGGGPKRGGTTSGWNGSALLSEALGDPRTATCSTCHPAATYPLGGIHHDTRTAATNDCLTCHGVVNHQPDHTALVSTVAPCSDCHTATAGTSTGIPVDMANGAVHDSCRTCHTFNSTTFAGQLVAPTNNRGVTVMQAGSCTTCHTSVATMHHNNGHSLVGECEYCHADPRNKSGQTIFVETAPVGGIPSHLPCEECHVTPETATGWAGNQMVILAFNEGGTHSTTNYATDFTRTTAHSGGHVIGNTVGKINTWGICFSCHDGQTGNAVRVNLFHAKPTAITPTNLSCGTTGTSRYAPGREITNNMGNFDFFASTFRPASTRPGGSGSCRQATEWSTAIKYGTTDFTASDLVVPDPWNTATGTQTVTVPAFPAQTKNTFTTPAADNVKVTSAVWNGTNLIVNATNTGACNALTAVYNGNNQAFTGTGPCTATFATSVIYTSTVPTLDVNTTNPGGINVSAYRINDLSNAPFGHSEGDGYFTWETTCQSCHGVGSGSVNAPKGEIISGVHSSSCGFCHQGGSGGGALIGSASHATVGAIPHSCTECHVGYFDTHLHGTGSTHDVLMRPTDQSASNACNTCHRRGGSFTTNPLFTNEWSGTDGIRALHQLGCAECHSSTRTTNVSASYTSIANVIMEGTNVGCLDCHASRSASHGSHAEGDGTFAWVASCQECHGAGSTSVAPKGEIIAGVHSAGNGCSLCHQGGIGGALLIGSATNSNLAPRPHYCTDCHSGYFDTHLHGTGSTHDVLMRAGDVSAGQPCNFCHIVGGPTTGNPVFVNTWSDPNGILALHRQGCANCHSSTRTTNVSAGYTSVQDVIARGTNVGCLNCHDSRGASHGRHVEGDGKFAWEASCQNCHGAASLSLNAPKGEIIAGAHGDTCGLCHYGGVGGGVLIGSATNISWGVLPHQCSQCHTGGFDAHTHGLGHNLSMTGTDLSNGAACNTCHRRGGTTSANPYFVNEWTGVDGTLALHQNSCALCHSSTRTTNVKSPFTSVENVIMTSVDAGCLDCHADRSGMHGGHNATDFVAAGTCNSSGCHTEADITSGVHKGICADCHVNPLGGGTRVALTDGSALLGDASGLHRNATCLTCHPVATYPTGTIHHDTANATNGTCTFCHTGSTFGGNHTSLVATDLNCTTSNCHSATAGTATGVPVSPVPDKVHDACTTCHNSNGTLKGPYTNAYGKAILMPAGSSASNDGGGDCTACHGAYFAGHMRANHQNLVKDSTTPACRSCHIPATIVGTPTGIPVDPVSDKVHDACTTCHNSDGTLRTAYGRASAMPAGGGTCESCHGSSYFNTHTHSHNMGTAPALCLSCHDNNTAPYVGAGADHATHSRLGCQTCHDASTGVLIGSAVGKVAGNNCQVCHSTYFTGHTHSHTASVKVNTVTTPTTVNCVGCHTTATTSPFTAAGQTHSRQGCATCHDSSTGALIGSANGHAAGGECVTCHSSYFNGHTTHDSSTHDVLQRATDLSNSSACTTCHGIGGSANHEFSNSWGGATGIYALHVIGCTECHDSTRTTNVWNGTFNSVTKSYTSVNNVIMTGTSVGCLDCHFDRTINHGTHNSTDFKWSGTCDTCHPGTDVIADVHNSNCGLCHVDPAGGGTRRSGTDGNALLGDASGLGRNATCDTCHPVASFPRGGIHHDTTSAANNNCTTCHTASSHVNMIQVTATCTATCHAGTSGTVTGAPVSLTDSTVHDSCRTCHQFNATTKAGELRTAYGRAQAMPAGTSATNDGGGLCTACHTASMASTHHTSNAHALIGECEFCHADPRNKVGGTNFQETAPGGGIPTHLPCEECHVTPKATTGWASSQMTILAFNEGSTHSTTDYATDFTRTTAHSGGHVIANTVGKINNWGICFSCHDGSKAVRVNLFHAKATAITATNLSCGTTGTSRYAPGREATNSMGSFDFFASTFRPASTRPGGTGSCRQAAEWTGAVKPGATDFTFTDTAVPDPWNTATGTQTQTVPLFPAQTQLTATTASGDNVQVQSATWNGTNIVVTATNSDGCSALTATYNGNNQAFTGSGTCTATFGTGVVYNTNVKTLDVTTSNTSGVSVTGYRISDATVFTGHNDSDGRMTWTGATACQACHGAGSSSTAAPKGTIVAGVHSGTCGLCHLGGVGGAALIGSGTNASGAKPYACTACHVTYFDGHIHGTGSTHAVLQRTTDLSATKACNTCHKRGGTTSANPLFTNAWSGTDGISALHQLGCTECHDSTRTTNLGGSYTSINNVIMTGTTVACLDCHADRATGHAGHNPTDFVRDATCNTTCHPGTDIVATVHGGSCGLCHVNPGGGGTRLAGTDGSALLGDASGLGRSATCLTCHPSATYPTGGIHHDTPMAVNGACATTCHTATNHTTMVQATAACITCHTATAGTASGVPVSLVDSKVHDNCFACHQFNATTKAGELRTAYGRAQAMPAGTSATNDGGGACTACHTATMAATHHTNNAHALIGECEFCHADPRNDGQTGFEETASVPNPIPNHLPCEECHVTPKATTGWAGNQMTILAFNEGGSHSTTDYTTDFTRTTAHSGGHAIANTVGRINNWGICFSCHDGTKAVAVNQFHAKPTALSVTNLSCGAGGTSAFAPGREVRNTMAGFDFFASTFRPASTRPGGSGSCRQAADWTDTVKYGSTDYTATDATVPDPWSSTGTNTLPMFPQQTPLTAVVQVADDVQVQSATWNGTNIVVTATNTDGCAALTATYNGNNQAFTGTGTCTATFGTGVVYTSSVPTVDVTTSNSLGVNVTGFVITDSTVFSGHNDSDGRMTWTGATTCQSCHGTGSPSTAAPKGAIVAGVHSANCAFCHQGGVGGAALIGSATNATGPMPYACTACHVTYFDGHTHGTGSTHAVLQRSTDLSGTAACNTCHRRGGTTSANPLFTNAWSGTDGISALHQIGCAECHESTRTTNLGGSYTSINNVIMTGTAVGCLDCHADRSVTHAGHNVTDFVRDAACNTTCHPGTDIVLNVHKNICGNCHVNPSGGGTRTAGSDGSALLGDSSGLHRLATCLTCHPTATYPTGGIHHDTTLAANNNCTTTCHTAASHTNLIQATAACTTCHTATAGTASSAPVSLTDSKVHDACRTCHQFNATTKAGELRVAYGRAQAMPAGTSATNDGGGACTACHTASMASTHHTSNAHALIGECEFCHADPRNKVGGTNFQETAPGGGIPTHLPCEECHVTPKTTTGWAGSQMTILAFNEGGTHSTTDYATDFTRTTAHSGGHVIANTVGKINNWGICFSCHDGSAAVRVNLFHAKATAITATNLSCGTTGTSRYAPGREATNTMGSFDFFASTFRPASTRPGGSGSCKVASEWTGSVKPGATDFTFTDTAVPDPWNTATGTQTQTVPLFAAQTATTITSPTADNVKVLTAAWNGTNIIVTATTTNATGCTTLTATYNGNNQAFTGSGTCTATFGTGVTYNTSVPNLDVTTSNTQGLSVTGYRISTP